MCNPVQLPALAEILRAKRRLQSPPCAWRMENTTRISDRRCSLPAVRWTIHAGGHNGVRERAGGAAEIPTCTMGSRSSSPCAYIPSSTCRVSFVSAYDELYGGGTDWAVVVVVIGFAGAYVVTSSRAPWFAPAWPCAGSAPPDCANRVSSLLKPHEQQERHQRGLHEASQSPRPVGFRKWWRKQTASAANLEPHPQRSCCSGAKRDQLPCGAGGGG